MKCPFCKIPCGNDHCPYEKEEEKVVEDDKILKGLEEENKRLKEIVKNMQNYIIERTKRGF